MTPSLDGRLLLLERQLRRTRKILAVLIALTFVVPILALKSAHPEVLRVRGLVVVDERGRERIFLGAPVPNPSAGERIAPATGLVINDSAGVERFGLSLFPNGRIVMGSDAPPGTGDDRNSERLSLGADERGGSYIRFLDRTTRAKALLRLDDDNRVYIEFLDWQAGKIVTRRIGFGGDTRIHTKR